MKTTLFSILILFAQNVLGQDHQVSLDYRYAIPLNNLMVHVPTLVSRADHRHVRSVNDQGILMTYQYQVYKKWKIFLSAGLDLSQSLHYQPILEGNGRYHLDNIIIKKNRISPHFGLHKHVALYDDKLTLDFGIELVRRFYGQEIDVYSIDYQSNNESWIQYKYDLTTYYDKHHANGDRISNRGSIRAEYMAKAKFKLSERLRFNFGFTFAPRNFFFYNYSYRILYYHNGSTTPTASYHFAGLLDWDIFGNPLQYGVEDHYLYLNTGLTFRF